MVSCNIFSAEVESNSLNYSYIYDEDLEDHDEIPVQYIYGSEEYKLYLIAIAHKGFLLRLDYSFGLYVAINSDETLIFEEFSDDFELDEYE
jgi:hypothetical protein